MQALIAIPGQDCLERIGGARHALTRQVGGLPLLFRVMQTAVCAGIRSAIVLWPSNVPLMLWLECQQSLLREGMTGLTLVTPEAHDPRKQEHWAAIAPLVNQRILWLPWNWITPARALGKLMPMTVMPSNWAAPHLIGKQALYSERRYTTCFVRAAEGVAVTSDATAHLAERLLGAPRSERATIYVDPAHGESRIRQHAV